MNESRRPGHWRQALRSHRFVGYAMVLILAIGMVEVVASTLFYEAIDRESVQEDHARRVAELLVVSNRVHDLAPDKTATVMSTHHLNAQTSVGPGLQRDGDSREVKAIRHHIVTWEPELGRQTLRLDIEAGRYGQRDLVGAMRLENGSWLNFRSRDISKGWPIALRAMLVTMLITALCVGIGFYALRVLTAPLRKLSEAAATLSHGQALSPISESGPADLRNLARSFNDMQARISGLVDDQARSFEAISHDLRTPLARLKLASGFVAESDIARLVSSSADEMEGMLMSLQGYLRAQHLECEAGPVDVAAAVRDIAAPYGDKVRVTAPPSVMVESYHTPLVLAVKPLLDNALHYGTHADVRLKSEGERWVIEVADDGPGVDEADFERMPDPFFRADEARARDTAGFGLGIPTAYRLMQRFGGDMRFRNGNKDGSRGSGLIVGIVVPVPDDED